MTLFYIFVESKQRFEAIRADENELELEVIQKTQDKAKQIQQCLTDVTSKGIIIQSWEPTQPLPSANARFSGYDPRVHVRKNQPNLVL